MPQTMRNKDDDDDERKEGKDDEDDKDETEDEEDEVAQHQELVKKMDRLVQPVKREVEFAVPLRIAKNVEQSQK